MDKERLQLTSAKAFAVVMLVQDFTAEEIDALEAQLAREATSIRKNPRIALALGQTPNDIAKITDTIRAFIDFWRTINRINNRSDHNAN